MSHLQTYYHFKLDLQRVDQHTEGKWLIHGTKRRKDNHLKSLELCNIMLPSRNYHYLSLVKNEHLNKTRSLVANGSLNKLLPQ